ncbi:MAG: hypothetical protein ISS61_07035 [Desulfobacteraceae bacterium]|nr:hypothetical protein [Desulfobacteraceae bacterium]
MSRFSILFLAMILGASFLHGCAGQRLPIDVIKKDLQGVPSYSIILEDMDEKGTFFKSYYQKYRIVQGERAWTTDWVEVPKDYYQRNENFLGMTLLSKKEGQYNTSVGPPGYNYVGDEQYGKWQRDSSGNSFWAFYGKYALISHLLGGSRIYRTDYNTYRNYRRQGRPYYGRNKQYGTGGRLTKSQKPNFYSRRAAKVRASKTSFSQKVNQRIGRARSGYRSRSYSGGK